MLNINDEADGITVVDLAEDNLTASNAGQFRSMLAETIQEGRLRLVIDLQGVSYVDSSGLGALVGILKRLGAKGDLVICAVGPAVMSVFKLTRMDKVFAIETTRQAAIERLSR